MAPPGNTLHTSSIIDLVFTNFDEITVDIMQTPRVSDHYILSLDVANFRRHRSVPLLLISRGRNLDYNLINAKLLEARWDFSVRDVNLKYKIICESIMNVLNEIAPKKEIKIFSRFKPWWNERTKEAVKMRDSSYKKYKFNKNDTNHNEHKRYRNNAVRVLREEKIKYFELKIDSCRNNTSEMWNTFKTIFPKNNSKSFIKEIEFDNEIVRDMNILPNKLNNFYVKSIEDIISKVGQTNQYASDWSSEPNAVHLFLEFILLDKTTLKEIVFSFKNKNSPDELDIGLIKSIYNGIEDPLLNLINSSLEQVIVPADLKLSTILPIQKKKICVKASNFRLINMLPSIEKILERHVYK